MGSPSRPWSSYEIERDGRQTTGDDMCVSQHTLRAETRDPMLLSVFDGTREWRRGLESRGPVRARGWLRRKGDVRPCMRRVMKENLPFVSFDNASSRGAIHPSGIGLGSVLSQRSLVLSFSKCSRRAHDISTPMILSASNNTNSSCNDKHLIKGP